MRVRPFTFLFVLLLAACSQVTPRPSPTLAPAATSFSYQRQFGSSGSGDGQFNNPRGIALDAQGNSYVADSDNERVQVFNTQGSFVRTFGSEGSGEGQFSGLRGVTLDAQGNIYTTETGNERVQVFDAQGTFVRTFGSSGSGDGQFSDPFSAAVDAQGSIYVLDAGNNRVQVFNAQGAFLRTFGSGGPADGQFSYPIGITLDAQSNLYVADSGNDRVQVFDTQGTFLRTFGGDGQLSGPRGVAADAQGNVYVLDTNNNRVQVFDAQGTFVTTFGSSGSGNGQLNFPRGIALDVQGSVYVADSGNNRVQVFTEDPPPDTTKPTITLTTPADNATYGQGESVTVSYSCADEENGSGLKSCTGTTENGSALDTSTPGSYSFTVNAEDNVGNTNSVTHTYTVQAPPTTPDTYTIDLETAPLNKILYSVKVGQGVIYMGSGTSNKDAIRVDGFQYKSRKRFGGNQVKVINVSGDKVLTVVKAGTNTPNPTGGELDIKPAQSFGGPSKGKNGLVILKSVTVNGISSSGAKLVLYGDGKAIKTISLSRTPSQTLALNESGVGFIQVRANDDFTVDDVVFEVPAKQ